jgi:hypothetical protein
VSFTLEQAARLYQIPLIDYERPSKGLLVGSGAGTMMATMDALPCLRWCFDIDRLPTHDHLGDFLLMAEPTVWPIVVVGWFSLTNPEPLQAAIAALRLPPFTYAGDRRLGGIECPSLGELVLKLKGA